MDDKILKQKLEALKNSRSKFENISKLLNKKILPKKSLSESKVEKSICYFIF